MRTANRAFQLEATYPGIFLLQGWLGGIAGGYITMVSICLMEETADLLFAVFWMPMFVIPASIVAVVTAIIFRAGYWLTGMQLGPVERVVVTTFCVSLIALFIAFQFEFEEADQVAELMGTLVLASLPTALLVGSRFKPWELCTFGSMAVTAHGDRIGSKSVLATLGTLPLRFLTLGALAFWILIVACRREITTIPLEIAAALSVSVIYFVFSAYVTFRSPRKTNLLMVGLLLNLTVVALLVLADLKYASARFAPEMIVAFSVIFTFVVAWVLFLAARLSVPTHRIPTELNRALLQVHDQRDHECLGSRFLQWNESEAI